MKSIISTPEGRLHFSIRLIPRSSRNEVVGWLGSGELKVRVTSPPVDEAANKELLRFLAKTLGLKKNDLTIITGAHSKLKRLEAPETCKNQLLSFEDI